MLQVTEIYKSVQGESTWAGVPCTFVRLTGCPLRCRWCDTVYGFKGGKPQSVDEILAQVESLGVSLVELTGGEPMAQAETPELIRRLIEKGFTVLIETGGSESIEPLPPETRVILDIKCPGSNMSDRNRWENLAFLKAGKDEVKFVVASREDFDWACGVIEENKLESKCTVLISPAWGLVKPADLVSWMLEKPVAYRLNLQTHKYIWSPTQKGV